MVIYIINTCKIKYIYVYKIYAMAVKINYELHDDIRLI